MLSKIWCLMIIFGIFFTVINGKCEKISSVFLEGAAEAMELFWVMAGAVAFWSGIMKIAEKSGLIKAISEKMRPILEYLFPDIPKGHKALDYISLNIAANFLGLGWAATPSGIMAVREMDKLNRRKGRATNAMCMFLVINMSSVQLISMNIISYRLKYGSENPAEIVLPGIIATTVSTAAAVWACRMCEKVEK